jgi:hypothetical protein
VNITLHRTGESFRIGNQTIRLASIDGNRVELTVEPIRRSPVADFAKMPSDCDRDWLRQQIENDIATISANDFEVFDPSTENDIQQMIAELESGS